MYVLVLCLAAALPQSFGHAATTPTIQDVSYSSVHYRCTLDLYLPDGACEPAPLVLFIHGGGWVVGDKSDIGTLADDLLSRGFAVASMNYRFSYQATFPAQIHDCKAAVRWLRAHASQYNLNPDQFGAFGESAGAYLAALLGTSAGDPGLEGDTGNNAFSSSVHAVGDLYGPIDLAAMGLHDPSPDSSASQLIGRSIPEILQNFDNPAYASWVALLDQSNPMSYIDSSDPPFFIAHGSNDPLVPLSQSQNFAAALTVAGVPVDFVVASGAGHSLPAGTYDQLFDFFESSLDAAPRQGWMLFAGKNSGDRFGQSVAFAGDVNNDGVVDMLIAAPYSDLAGSNAGQVYVYSGATGHLLWSLKGEHAADRFGWSIAPAGDVNADHYDDFLVGAPLNDAGGSNAGRVYLFSGKSRARLLTITGKAAGDQFGYAIAGAADLSGDGKPDFAVGAPFANTGAGGSNTGKVYVFHAHSGATLDAFNGQNPGDNFGKALALAGRVNADSRADLLIGAPGNDAAGNSAGRAYVYGRVGSSFVRLLTFTGAGPGHKLGTAVCGAGDINADGADDLLIGSPGADNSATDSGAASVYSGLDGAVLFSLTPDSAEQGQNFGSSLAAASLPGLGGGTLAVARGARDDCGFDVGAVDIFDQHGSLVRSILGRRAERRFGRSLSFGSDLDGDGFSDLLVGSHLANHQTGGTVNGSGRAVLFWGQDY